MNYSFSSGDATLFCLNFCWIFSLDIEFQIEIFSFPFSIWRCCFIIFWTLLVLDWESAVTLIVPLDVACLFFSDCFQGFFKKTVFQQFDNEVPRGCWNYDKYVIILKSLIILTSGPSMSLVLLILFFWWWVIFPCFPTCIFFFLLNARHWL